MSVPIALDQVQPGALFRHRLVDRLSRTQIIQYAGASGDYNPLHTDDVYARETAGYPGIFAHGMLTMGLTGKILTDLFGAEAPVRFGLRFGSIVWPGDTLDAIATVAGLSDDGGTADLVLAVVNQRDEEVATGTATVRLDGLAA